MYKIALFLSCIPLSILVEGIGRKLYARMQNRIGPPITQPFYDLMKLWKKKTNTPAASRNFIFVISPIVSFIISALLLSLIFGIIKFQYDFIFFIYLFIAVDVFLLVGALASKSTFPFLSAMRDFVLMIGYELIFAFCLLSFFVNQNNISSYSNNFALLYFPVSSVLIFLSGFPILKITPYDTISADTEVSSGMETEYSGRLLFFFKLTEYIRNFSFYLILSISLIGFNIYSIIAFGILLILYSNSKATTPRFKFMKTAKHMIVIALVSFVNLIFVMLKWV